MKRAASAAPSAVVAIINSGAVTNWPHTNKGIRVNVIPGARIFKMVTRKFMPVIVEPIPMRNTAAHHIEVPAAPCNDIGGYSVQPATGAPMRNDEYSIRPATGKIQYATMLSHGNATSRAPICTGMTRFPNPPVSSGMITNQTIVDPCIVNTALYVSGVMNPPFAFIN